jgi:hypothetical protein
MSKIRLILLVTIMTTIGCAVFGGGATEETATDTPTKEATATRASAGIQKEATPSIATKVKEEPTSAPEEAETPRPTTSSVARGETQELIFPLKYAETDDAKDIELVDFRVFRNEFWGGDLILGLIRNTGAAYLTSINVDVGAIDASGETIASGFGSPCIGQFNPGETISFNIHFGDKFPEETKEILIAIRARDLNEYYYGTHNYEVVSSDAKRLSDGNYLISVRFRNNNDYDTDAVFVGITLFDSNNRIIGSGAGFTESTRTVIPAGAEAEINFTQYFVIGEVERCEFIIQGSRTEEE